MSRTSRWYLFVFGFAAALSGVMAEVSFWTSQDHVNELGDSSQRAFFDLATAGVCALLAILFTLVFLGLLFWSKINQPKTKNETVVNQHSGRL